MSLQLSDLINLFRQRGRGDPPSAIADLFINPIVAVSSFLGAKEDFARAEQTLDTALALLEDPTTLAGLAGTLGTTSALLTTQLQSAIEDIGSNFGIFRRPATVSSGNVLLTRNSSLIVPPNSPITIQAGTKLFSPFLNQQYQITDTFIITAMTFNSTLQLNVFAVPVQSVGVGIGTVAAANQITQLKEPITGIDGVTNLEAVIGGKDQETDSALVTRIKQALSQNNIGTASGYRTLVLSIADVKDTSIVGAGDPFMVRDNAGGGAVDIYVADAIPLGVSELTNASNFFPFAGKFKFVPSRQPLINNIAGVQPNESGTIIIVKDTGVFAGSIKAQDYILFNSNHPSTVISYQVNSLIGEVDTFMQDPSRKIFGSDVLIREAGVVLADVIMTIQILPEFSNSSSTVRNNVVNAIVQEISSLGIGESLEQSNIIKVAAEVPGVAQINIPLTKFQISTGTGVVNTVVAQPNQIVRSGTIIVTS